MNFFWFSKQQRLNTDQMWGKYICAVLVPPAHYTALSTLLTVSKKKEIIKLSPTSATDSKNNKFDCYPCRKRMRALDTCTVHIICVNACCTSTFFTTAHPSQIKNLRIIHCNSLYIILVEFILNVWSDNWCILFGYRIGRHKWWKHMSVPSLNFPMNA